MDASVVTAHCSCGSTKCVCGIPCLCPEPTCKCAACKTRAKPCCRLCNLPFLTDHTFEVKDVSTDTCTCFFVHSRVAMTPEPSPALPSVTFQQQPATCMASHVPNTPHWIQQQAIQYLYPGQAVGFFPVFPPHLYPPAQVVVTLPQAIPLNTEEQTRRDSSSSDEKTLSQHTSLGSTSLHLESSNEAEAEPHPLSDLPLDPRGEVYPQNNHAAFQAQTNGARMQYAGYQASGFSQPWYHRTGGGPFGPSMFSVPPPPLSSSVHATVARAFDAFPRPQRERGTVRENVEKWIASLPRRAP